MQELLEEVLHLYHRDKITMLPTRWLSLGPAVERLLKRWPAIVSYFKSGTDCPRRVAKCLGLPAPEVNEQDDGSMRLSLSITEAYLQFL